MFQPRAFVLISLLFTACASQAGVHIECKPAKSDPCAEMPAPPAPPVPPAPPARLTPPAPLAPPHAHTLAMAPLPPAPPPAPAAPAEPALPAPPAPPAPPPLPTIPDELHAACAGKQPGTRLSRTLSPGETMSGFCERSKGRMVFRMRSYHRE